MSTTFTLRSYPEHFVKYLGTGGARFSMLSQVRATGGIWFSYGGLTGVVDPGPGSLVQICTADPKLDAKQINAIFLTHRHLDHSTDINVLAEAMTSGGFDRHGAVVLPSDAVHGDDPVFLKYMAKKVEETIILRDGKLLQFGAVTVEPVKHVHHGVDCFGFIFRKEGLRTWGVISDTKPLDFLADRYAECDYVSINTTFPDKKARLDHLSVMDAGEILQKMNARLATLTHLGMIILNDNPDAIASRIDTEETRVLAGRDGMVINLETLDVIVPEEIEKTETRYEII